MIDKIITIPSEEKYVYLEIPLHIEYTSYYE